MASDELRCGAARTLKQIDDAFRRGDLDALRAAVGDARLVPNGPMPNAIGPCLVYAVYHSPVSFIRTLLEIGADPTAPVDDGFPPLIAALTCTRDAAGARQREDVDQIIRLLLSFGADPNVRGINDYTALHMAVAERNGLAVLRLLDAGADSGVRTRIDRFETPAEMAQAAGLASIAELLAPGGPPPRRLRSGLTLLADIPGDGSLVLRQRDYRMQLRLSSNEGVAFRWHAAWGPVGRAHLEDDGATLITQVRINRGQLMNGLFYGVEGMRVGGTRRLRIAPHLAYGARGVPGIVPPGAEVVAEVTILSTVEMP